MRNGLAVLLMTLLLVASATAQVSVAIGLPTVSIGINLPRYPELVRVPGYPVYYAPRLNSNYFFYDGMYWVYQDDSWYTSSWYNGPWGFVEPQDVPVYILRVPVRYYRQRPAYFQRWKLSAAPRWGEHWGHEWEQRRRGWDRWDRKASPQPAPLPLYQRNYSGDRYPHAEQQSALQSKKYHYQPHDPTARQHFQAQRVQKAPESPERGERRGPQERHAQPPSVQRSNSSVSIHENAPAPHLQPLLDNRDKVGRSASAKAAQHRRGESIERSAPTQATPQRRGPVSQQESQHPEQGARESPPAEPRARSREAGGRGKGEQGKGAPQQQGRGQEPGHERNRGNAEERGQDRKN